MEIKDIIKEKYKVARKYYETYKHTTECSYYMGYMDALGELLERIEQEEEKKIPEKIPIGLKQTKDGIFNTIVRDDIQYELNEKEEIICKKIHEIIDYFKSKGE